MTTLRVLLTAIGLSCCCVGLFAAAPPPPRPPEDISAEIVKSDANSCQVSDRLLGSMTGLPGCLVDLSSSDGQRLVRQVDNFRKPGSKLQGSGEAKVIYHSWLDVTQAQSASILGFIKGGMEKNDRLEVKSTMLPGVSVLPEDLDYAKIAAVFKGMPQAEIDKYGIVMGVMVYEVSGAIYNTSNRKIDIDWPCFSLAGGKTLLYKSGEEKSTCILMAVYAPVPFCIDLDVLSRTPPDKAHDNGVPDHNKATPGNEKATALGNPDMGIPDAGPLNLSHIGESGPAITELLKMYMGSHKPTVGIADPPRAVGAREAM